MVGDGAGNLYGALGEAKVYQRGDGGEDVDLVLPGRDAREAFGKFLRDVGGRELALAEPLLIQTADRNGRLCAMPSISKSSSAAAILSISVSR